MTLRIGPRLREDDDRAGAVAMRRWREAAVLWWSDVRWCDLASAVRNARRNGQQDSRAWVQMIDGKLRIDAARAFAHAN